MKGEQNNTGLHPLVACGAMRQGLGGEHRLAMEQLSSIAFRMEERGVFHQIGDEIRKGLADDKAKENQSFN